MIIKVTPDKEKVKSIMFLVKEREEFVKTVDQKKFTTIAVENYYEIIKELASSLILLDGLKATGENAHKDLFEQLTKKENISQEEASLMNDMRIKRNNSYYEGRMVEANYLENHLTEISQIIDKLKKAVTAKLDSDKVNRTNNVTDDFPEVKKMVDLASGAKAAKLHPEIKKDEKRMAKNSKKGLR